MDAPKVGLYLRLSREDGDCEAESQSITNQRDFLQRYVEQRNWTIADIYIDDGYTGTNFDRPAFQRLLRDIEHKRINTVITKDLSRLGRDQINTMYFYQIYFPQKQIRYIAVNEGMDTGAGNSNDMMLPFLAAANDFYTADISRKVRAALDTRKNNGCFIGSQAPLGYQKDPRQKGRLIPDPSTADIVRLLFQTYLSCGSVAGTAKVLTEQRVPTPSECKRTAPTQTRFPGVWSENIVRRILKNPTYIGNLTQNRSRKIGYKVDKKINLPPEEWITVPDTHEAIISPEVFEQAQEQLAVRSYLPQEGEGHLLTGLAFCADCGAPMTYMRESGSRTYMVCQGYRRGGRLGLCTAHCMREDFVIETIRQQLQTFARRLDAEALERSIVWGESRQQSTRQLDSVLRKLEANKKVAQSLYRDKATGMITEREFRELFDHNRRERERLEQDARTLAAYGEDGGAQEQVWQRLRTILGFQTLDRGTLAALIERVLIHGTKEIEIRFKFQKPE